MVIFLTEDPSLFSISLHVMSINTVLGITLTPIKDSGTPEIISIQFSKYRDTIKYFTYFLVLVQIQSVEHAQHSH